MWAINIISLYNCTKRSISPFRQSHVVHFPRGRVKSIEMYHYTKSTLSQTLTVVQHTFSICKPPSVFSIHIILWSYSIIYYYYYCCGRVCPCCCRLISVDTYATCHMHALNTLELRGGPEHARSIRFTLTAFFYLSSYRFRTEIFPFFCFVLSLDYQMSFCYIISFNILVYICYLSNVRYIVVCR